MLFIGMVTEVLVFLISAFDTPVRDYPLEQVFPVLASQIRKTVPTPLRSETMKAGQLHDHSPQKRHTKLVRDSHTTSRDRPRTTTVRWSS